MRNNGIESGFTKFGIIVSFLIVLMFCAVPSSAGAQVSSAFAVFDIPASARTASLGMDVLAVDDNDISLALDNPSLIGSRFHANVGLNYVRLFDGANAGAAFAGFHTRRLGDFVAGLRFYTFGEFQGHDETETSTGAFLASDFIFSLGWGMHIDSAFSLGATLKPIASFYDTYNATALALDVAATYRSPSRQLAATLIACNIGSQFSTFGNVVEKLPFHLDAALSYKLSQAPLRFYVQLADMQKWNLAYYDTLSPTATYDIYTNTTTKQSPLQKFSDNLFRHINVGAELAIAGRFFARVGYSYRQTREMAAETRSNINLSGFGFGVGVRARRMEITYGRNNYHLGQSPNYLTIVFRL